MGRLTGVGAMESHWVRDRDILAERVRLLFRQAKLGFVATVVNGFILTLVLWAAAPSRWGLLIWFLALLAITAWRVYVLRAYRNQTDTATCRQWQWRFAIGAYAVGACWGVAGTLLFPLELPAYQTFVLTVLAGMSAGAVPLLGSIWSVYAGYAVLMLLPTGFWLFLQGGAVHPYIALMVLIYLATVLASAARISANIKESLRLRYERSDLIERLSRSKAELEATNRELAAEAQLRQDAQRQLQDSNRFLERVMDSANDGIFVLDPRGRLCRINHAMAGFAGAEAADLIGMPFVNLFTAESRKALKPALESAQRQSEPSTLRDLELSTETGEVRCLSVSIAPILENHEGRALVGVARDVTSQRRLERMKEDFISTVSHELRTPLTSIRGALGLVNRTSETQLDSQTRSLLNIADSNSERLLRLIDDLLDLQSLGTSRMRFRFSNEPVAEMIEHSVEINQAYAQHHNVRLRVVGRLDDVYVRVDRDRFMQVLTNLISNAAKFSSPGSEILLYAETVPFGVRVSVEDQGPGVPLEFRNHVFERFSQADGTSSRNKGGTGLGLSISKSLIESMQGRIGFSSEIGKGSVFFVELPLADSRPQAGETENPPPA